MGVSTLVLLVFFAVVLRGAGQTLLSQAMLDNATDTGLTVVGDAIIHTSKRLCMHVTSEGLLTPFFRQMVWC